MEQKIETALSRQGFSAAEIALGKQDLEMFFDVMERTGANAVLPWKRLDRTVHALIDDGVFSEIANERLGCDLIHDPSFDEQSPGYLDTWQQTRALFLEDIELDDWQPGVSKTDLSPETCIVARRVSGGSSYLQ